MPIRTDLTDAPLALIPEHGSRVSNEQLRAATTSGNGRSRRNGNGTAATSTQPLIATGTTEASVLCPYRSRPLEAEPLFILLT